MIEGIKLMEQRAKELQEGKRIPVLERPITVEHHIITGFASAEHYTDTYWNNPTGIEVDHDGTLYLRQTVNLVKPLVSNGWELGDDPLWER